MVEICRVVASVAVVRRLPHTAQRESIRPYYHKCSITEGEGGPLREEYDAGDRRGFSMHIYIKYIKRCVSPRCYGHYCSGAKPGPESELENTEQQQCDDHNQRYAKQPHNKSRNHTASPFAWWDVSLIPRQFPALKEHPNHALPGRILLISSYVKRPASPIA